MKRREFGLKSLGLAASLTAGLSIGTPGGWSTELAAGDAVFRPGDAAIKGKPRLPAGARVLTIGDSLFQDASLSIPGENNFGLANMTLGEITWAMALDPRFNFDIWQQTFDRQLKTVLWDGDNQGIGGTRITRLADPKELAHLGEIDPDVVIVGFGANDLPSSRPVAEFISRLTDFCDLMVERDNRRVVVATIRPHSDAAKNSFYVYKPGDPKWDAHFAINDFILSNIVGKYPEGTVSPWNTFASLADPDSYRGGLFRDGLSRDGVHLTESGAWNSGKALVPVLAEIIEPAGPVAAGAVSENLLPNPKLASLRNISVAGVSGNVPEGITVFRSRGEEIAAIVSSVPDAEFGGDKLVITFQPNQTETMHEFGIMLHPDRVLPIRAASGGFVQLRIPFETEATSKLIGVMASVATDTFERFSNGLQWSGGRAPAWHGEAMRGWIVTPPLQLGLTSAGVRCGVKIRLIGGNKPFSVSIRPNMSLTLINDPRRATRSGLV